MNTILAIFAGIIGLFVTGAAVFTAWVYVQRRKEGGTQPKLPDLTKWSVFDAALLILFALGFVFLLTDVVAVIRDQASYPMYHYGYLLCGFIFTCMGMLFMVVRLAMLLSFMRADRVPAPNEHSHPSQADSAE
ncbi:hypothetical protein [Paenibacillus thalictri]|uniref:Uncharacterized protein n=1 Tax=Paenibacillus thalictri TaxID=2527873 RepID=A0A4V2J3K7_9BACL|nr:hypothetical protein [Paenibacillus thalictri]TBL73217.1 hypothetical protein EYB31_26395 [Paenibacillus thalictri]